MAQEDHAQRAVLTALGLHQRLAQRFDALAAHKHASTAVRMGLHTGLVTVSSSGHDQVDASVIIGDTAAMARALQGRAAAGTILCTASTARLLRETVRTETAGPVQLSGHPHPVMTYTILAHDTSRLPGTSHRPQPMSQFVGRGPELATLHALLGQVETGSGHTIGIAGPPGIGKSRLLDELRHSVSERPLTYLTGRCFSYAHATPYLPIIHLVKHACRILGTDAAETITAKVQQYLRQLHMDSDEWLPYLLQLLGVPADAERHTALTPQVMRARTFASLLQMSLNVSRQQPLVIEIEDLHWIDATSEAWLTALVERLADAPILLLTTYRSGYRPPWLERSEATQLALSRLTPSESRQVVQGTLRSAWVPDRLVQDIVTKADGNPFFLEELSRTVEERGAHGVSLTVPDTIQAVVAPRIDRLPSRAKRLLQTAAVIGKDVPYALLAATAGLPEGELVWPWCCGSWAILSKRFDGLRRRLARPKSGRITTPWQPPCR
ncbi:MAG: AAA family ATPase [Candidatus Tectomicrobia bacterium]